MKLPIKGIHIAIALLALCYCLIWWRGPHPTPAQGPAALDAMTTREFLQYASLDVNTVGREDLMELPGIGEKLADAILEYREAHGPFSTVEELEQVPGMGRARLDGIRLYIHAG